jgi:hypothetical protein
MCIINTLAIVVLLLCATSFAYGQVEKFTKDLRFNDEVLGCDESVALQDLVVSEALGLMQEESFLIVVIRPGNNDNNDLLTQRRLFNVKQYFRDRGSRLNNKKVLIVLGAPVDGQSRLEYYLNGKLFLSLIYPNKGFICHSCCGPDPAYYPYKKMHK